MKAICFLLHAELTRSLTIMEITAALFLASWLVSADPQVHCDLAYTEPKNQRKTLDVYGPAEGKNHPIIFWIHGGGWQAGDKPTQALFDFLGNSGGIASGAEARSLFLFSYFLGNGEDGLHLAFSRDGYHWTALNQGRSFLAPQAGHKLMRDPCLLRGPDGVFHLVWTTGWGDRVIGYANSRDLIHWSPQRAIPVMMHEATARNAWAPELFYDEDQKQFLIFWASTIPGRFLETDRTGDDGWNHRIYSTTTHDFKTFTPTRLFFDAGFNVIDATILKARGQYYLIVKDETKTPVNKNLRIARSAKAEGPYQDVSAPISISWVEGPSAIQIGDEFLIYFDHYAAPQYYGALRSRDFAHWEDVSQKVKFPQGTRHGTILRVSEEVVARLASASSKQAFPTASPRRLDYFPPSENEGGWRTLLPESGLPNADQKAKIRQKTGMDWGKPPSLVEVVEAINQVPRGASAPVIYARDNRGNRAEAIVATASDGGTVRFKIGPPHATVWYAIDYAGGR